MIANPNISRTFRAAHAVLLACIAALAIACFALCAQPAYADDLQAGRIGDSVEPADEGLVAASDDMVDVTLWTTYGQTDARSILKMVNDFRHSDDAWYRDENDSTKKVYNKNLSDLTYDYALEKAAMQRAAEAALLFAHTRPNGAAYSTVATDLGLPIAISSENLAAGRSSATATFNDWREDDKGYDGQGHRRNMLSPDYTAIGIGHVVVNGTHFWVQEFGTSQSGAPETAADNSTKNVTMQAKKSNITTAEAFVQIDTVNVVEGNSVDLPTASAKLGMSVRDLDGANRKTQPGPTVTATVATDGWKVADTTIADVADDKLQGKKAGTTKMTTTLFSGSKASVNVVVKADLSDATVSFSPGSYVYTGSPITPAPVVKRNGETLSAITDYTVEYQGNTNVGTATVTVKGSGLYAGSAKGTFEITTVPIAAATVSVSQQRYTGKAITPSLVVTYGDKALKEGVDYEVVFTDNVEVGTAKATLTGLNNFTGETTATFEIADIPASWKRLQGNVALDTMKAIVDAGWSDRSGGTVVLTTVDGYWDALTAAGVAGMAKAPVLMTDTNSLSSQTEAILKKIKPATIVICGGTAAVTSATEEAAASAAGGANVVRCWGQTATGTAVNAYEKATLEGLGTWSDTAFVCTNDGYWDALAAAPISYAKAMPIFLTEGASDISDETLAAMKAGGVKSVYIVGGYAAIDQTVADKVAASGMQVAGRLAGDTAVETSEKVAAYGLTCDMTCANMGVATTNGYWDALAGAALCGLNGSVLVLAGDSSAHSINGFVKSHASEVGAAYVFGGEAALDADTYQALQKAVA